MTRILKYPVEMSERGVICLPNGSRVLSVARQGATLVMYAIVNEQPGFPAPEKVITRVFGTGHPISEHGLDGAKFMGTFSFHDGRFMCHVFIEEYA